MSDILDYKKLLEKQELADARYTKRICLFLGAGVARNLGMPDWLGLAQNIVEFCASKKLFTHSVKHSLLSIKDPLKIISYCINAIEKSEDENVKTESEDKNVKTEFKEKLKKWFIDEPNQNFESGKCSIYNDLIELYKSGKVLIVQTNYDNVIESHVKEEAEKEDCEIAHIPYLENNEIPLENNLIVYLHGKYNGNNFDDLVLTRHHYNDVYVLEASDKKQRQKLFFNKLFENYHVIFFGYSLQDSEIVQLIANKKETDGYKQIDIIIDTCDIKTISNEIDTSYWQQFTNNNINIYEYSIEKDGYKKFENVIKSLKDFILIPNEQPITVYTDPTLVEGI